MELTRQPLSRRGLPGHQPQPHPRRPGHRAGRRRARRPGHDDFTPLYEVVNVSGDDGSLTDETAIVAAAASGRISLEETPVVVNHPAVKWPGGELPVDPVVELPLANGPLLEAPDTVARLAFLERLLGRESWFLKLGLRPIIIDPSRSGSTAG